MFSFLSQHVYVLAFNEKHNLNDAAVHTLANVLQIIMWWKANISHAWSEHTGTHSVINFPLLFAKVLKVGELLQEIR